MCALSDTDIVVIGAGPYGLSIGAHLAARGLRFRIFGHAMETWRANMPEGMYLKSPGKASSLSDPCDTHSLANFCAGNGHEYRDWDWPVPVQLFAEYGQWFQRNLVRLLETRNVLACSRAADGFRLQVEGGETIRARSVVISSGFQHSARIPKELKGLPAERMSHSSAHSSLASFRGKRVVVVGAGQSALESAALLKESGASPVLLARRERLEWNPAPVLRRTPYEEIRRPRTGLGVGLRYAFYEHPFLPFYYLPRAMRHRQVDSVLGPAGAWWLRERVVGQIPGRLGWSLRAARAAADEVVLQVEGGGRTEELRADHVIAATGYQVSPASFPFLDQDLRRAVRWENGSPALSRAFESSVRGLHFVGVASARCFGPVMRFVDGAQVTAPRLAEHLARRHKG